MSVHRVQHRGHEHRHRTPASPGDPGGSAPSGPAQDDLADQVIRANTGKSYAELTGQPEVPDASTGRTGKGANKGLADQIIRTETGESFKQLMHRKASGRHEQMRSMISSLEPADGGGSGLRKRFGSLFR